MTTTLTIKPIPASTFDVTVHRIFIDRPLTSDRISTVFSEVHNRIEPEKLSHATGIRLLAVWVPKEYHTLEIMNYEINRMELEFEGKRYGVKTATTEELVQGKLDSLFEDGREIIAMGESIQIFLEDYFTIASGKKLDLIPTFGVHWLKDDTKRSFGILLSLVELIDYPDANIQVETI